MIMSEGQGVKVILVIRGRYVLVSDVRAVEQADKPPFAEHPLLRPRASCHYCSHIMLYKYNIHAKLGHDKGGVFSANLHSGP